MRIEIQNDNVICIAEDWKNLQRNEREFLSKSFFNAIWTEFTKDGNLMMGKGSSNAIGLYQRLKSIIYLAECYGIELTDEVGQYEERLKAEMEQERIKLEQAHAAKMLRERWEARKLTGCDYCKYSEQVGAAWFRCKLSGDELNCRVSSVYDYERQTLDLFHECGVPNEHCKDYFKDEIIETGGTV